MVRLRRWIVQELVTRMVLLHEAENAGLLPPSGAGLDEALEGGLPIIPDEVVARLFDAATGHVIVTEAELRAFHSRNADRYRTPEARHIRYALSPSGQARQALFEALGTGAPAPASGVSRCGDMWLRRGELVGPLEDAVFAAAPGDVVGPFELEQGWAAARLLAIAPASGGTFEEARSSIETELLAVARARAFDDWVAMRRAQLSVVEPDWEHPGHPVHGLPQHRH
jgi:[acyl-carrier-protein] S-malonyltransferase